LELVSNRETKEPLPEALVQAIVGDCMANSAVIIGATNRSISGFNNTLCLSPAYIATKSDIDEIVTAIDGAITRKMAAV
jgi:taurine-pyruvate aminotransferase